MKYWSSYRYSRGFDGALNDFSIYHGEELKHKARGKAKQVAGHGRVKENWLI